MRDALNDLGRVDTYIIERVSPLEYLTGQVLPYFPVYLADSGVGLYVGIWRYDTRPSDAVLTIDTSVPGYARVSAISWTDGEASNEISVEGQYSAASDSYCETILWSGDPEVYGTDTTVRSSPVLQRSHLLYGRRELSVQVPVVQDRPTLDRVAAYLSYRHALPRAEVSYRVPWRKVAVELGAVVIVEDAVVGLVSRLGIVTGRRYAGGALELRVSLLPVV